MTPLQTWGHLDHWGMSSSFQHSKKPVPHWGSKEQKVQAQCLCFPRSQGATAGLTAWAVLCVQARGGQGAETAGLGQEDRRPRSRAP